MNFRIKWLQERIRTLGLLISHLAFLRKAMEKGNSLNVDEYRSLCFELQSYRQEKVRREIEWEVLRNHPELSQ